MMKTLILFVGFIMLSCSPVEDNVKIQDLGSDGDILVSKLVRGDSLELNIPFRFRIINSSLEDISCDLEFKTRQGFMYDQPLLVSLDGVLHRHFKREQKCIRAGKAKELTFYYRMRIGRNEVPGDLKFGPLRDSVATPYALIRGDSKMARAFTESVKNDSLAFDFSYRGHVFLKIKRIAESKYYTLTEEDLKKSLNASIFDPALLRK